MMALFNSKYHSSFCPGIFLHLLYINSHEAFTTKTPTSTYYAPRNSQYDNSFHVRLNEFFKQPVPDPIKGAFSIFREETNYDKLDMEDTVTLLTAAPGFPGVPRPLWLVMLGSFPTGLAWYGYYKFCVEEELLEMELEAGKEPQGFGGYGFLGSSACLLLLGPISYIFDIPGGTNNSLLGVIFLYYTQFLLYDRVNKLYEEEENYNSTEVDVKNTSSKDKPLQAWWCLPIFFPFSLIVGMRQVHFLANYLYRKRGVLSSIPPDPVADFFPFIKIKSLTWQDLVLTPSLWCSILSDVENIDTKLLPEPVQEFLNTGK